jgi:Domain of unknown function (DUF4349)
MSPTRRIIAIPMLAMALGLAACSGGTSSSTSAAGKAVDQPARAAEAAAPSATSAASGAAAGGAAALPSPQVALVKTADLVVEVTDLKGSAARVRALAEGVGGTVSSETTSYSAQVPAPTATAATTDPTGNTPPPTTVQPGESVLVLRIPVAVMDSTIERAASIGKELSRTSSSQDVTADLADLGSRVKSQQASVDRVRALMAQADSLQNVVLLESELSRRQSDLDALAARQSALAGRAALSTLTVTLRTPEVKQPAAATDDGNGFVAGLRKGWNAVVVSTGIVLLVLGALLPVLVVAALIGVPVWWIARRRTARPPTPGTPLPAAPPSTPAAPPTLPMP